MNGQKLIEVVGLMLHEHFLKHNGLLELGWCSHYMMDKRNNIYPKDSKIPKTLIVEFYWLNSSSNRSYNQTFLTKVHVCNCPHCNLFKKSVLQIQDLFYLVVSMHYFIYTGIIIVIDNRID